nr:DUF4143 domain-containing protein [Frankia sp. AiPs1]
MSLELFGRHAAARVSAAFVDTRVVVLNGARQVGKSALAQLTVDPRGDAKSYYLDEEPVRAAAGGPHRLSSSRGPATVRRATHPSAPVGPLVENFVLGELARQLSWSEEPVSLFHYRDRDRSEVDAVLERASGEIVGVEVKAAETVRAEDFRGLRRLASQTGDRFHAGYVLYAGAEVLSFGPRLRAAPIPALWTTAPPAPSDWS